MIEKINNLDNEIASNKVDSREKRTKLDLLENLRGLAEKIKLSTLHRSFWEEQSKSIKETEKEREEMYNSIKMDYKKFVKPFDL